MTQVAQKRIMARTWRGDLEMPDRKALLEPQTCSSAAVRQSLLSIMPDVPFVAILSQQ